MLKHVLVLCLFSVENRGCWLAAVLQVKTYVDKAIKEQEEEAEKAATEVATAADAEVVAESGARVRCVTKDKPPKLCVSIGLGPRYSWRRCVASAP